MKDRELEKIIRDAQKYGLKGEAVEEQTRHINEYINIIAKYARNLVKENPKLNENNIQRYILKQFHNVSAEYSKIAYMRSAYYSYEAEKQLSEDREKIKEIYESIKQRTNLKENHKFTDDMQRNLTFVVEEVLCMLRKFEEENGNALKRTAEFMEEYEKASEKDKIKIRKKYNKSKQDIEIVKIILIKDYPTKIQSYIKNIVISSSEDFLKESQCKVLNLLYEEFSKYGFLEKYLLKYNRSMQPIFLGELNYEMSTGNYKPDEVGLKEVFSKEFIENMDVEKVMQMSTFWQNRYAKEVDALNSGFFAISTLNLWGDILKSDEKISIDSKTIKGISIKIKCMQKIVSKLLTNIQEKHHETKEEKEQGYMGIDPSKEIRLMEEQEGKNYKERFEQITKTSDNNLAEDIESYKTLYNFMENTYKARNSMFMTQIGILLSNKYSKNWGIVRNEYLGYGEYRNTDNDDYALIYVDCESFNMPLRLHVKKEKLIDVLKISNNEPIIPEYIGNKDFIVRGTLIKNNIFMPMLKKHKKFISKEYNGQSDTGKDRLLGHLRYLKDKGNGRFPKHLMEAIQTKDGMKYQMPKTKYFNLETGEEYYLENREYVPIDSDGGKNVHGR